MPFDNLPEPSQPSREVQLLRLARDSIGRQRFWTQGRWMTPDGRMCAVMAIRQVCTHCLDRTERRQMARRLIWLVQREMPLGRRIMMCWMTSRQRLIWFNDSRNTTHRQVMGLFNLAIERLEWREMSAVVYQPGV